jgi:hypothetical protein
LNIEDLLTKNEEIKPWEKEVLFIVYYVFYLQ